MNFTEKLTYTIPLWKIWLVGFIISISLISPITYFTTGYIIGFQWVAVILLSLLFSGITPAMLGLARESNKFYRKSDKVEEMIKNGDKESDVRDALVKLDKEAFHRTMGSRMRELGKMYEVKYNKKILK